MLIRGSDSRSSDFLTWTVIFSSILVRDFSLALRDVRVHVPHAVRRGDKAVLKCYYDIEDDSLYSVKWYKGRREFYRYTPKENPAMKIFQFPGVRIERSASNESQLVLESVNLATAGKYSCEVSADAPSFHTLIAAGELETVDIPHNPPLITGVRPRYRIGDILRGNCTSRHSRPAANLTWLLNNEEIQPAHIRQRKVLRDIRNDMETAIVSIQFMVTPHHFDTGKLTLRCIAEMFDVYKRSTEKIITEVHSKQSSSNGASVNMIHSEVELESPYDQYALHDSELLFKTDTSYLKQLQDFLSQFVSGIKSSSSPFDDDYEDPAWDSSGGLCIHRSASLYAVLLSFLLYVLGPQLIIGFWRGQPSNRT